MKNKLIPSFRGSCWFVFVNNFRRSPSQVLKDPFLLGGETQSFVLRLGSDQSTIERFTTELEFHMRNFCTSYYCLLLVSK